MTERLVDKIIQIEWENFQLVENEGGRASCQDDESTFRIMRASQYYLWPQNLLESYLDDLTSAAERGQNLMEQKYAWMMASTDPARFECVKHVLPSLSAEKSGLIWAILEIQLSWMEQFAQRYPLIALRGRKPSAETDSRYATSGITYLRGELSTYSKRTLTLYLEFVKELSASGRNLQTEITQEMMRLKGYHSLEQVEQKLACHTQA